MITAAVMMTIGFFNTPSTTGKIAAIFIISLSAEIARLLNKFFNIAIIYALRNCDARAFLANFLI